MWCIHSKSGFTGLVTKYHQVKSGKHGHTKCIYELRYPHNNKVAKESCSAKTLIKEAIVAWKSYLISDIEKERIDYKQLNAMKQQAKVIISGYAHSLHTFRIKSNAIPAVIMDLCLNYYFIQPSQQYNIVCLDNEFNELTFPVMPNNTNSKLIKQIQDYLLKTYLMSVSILECPKVNKKNVVMIQIVHHSVIRSINTTRIWFVCFFLCITTAWSEMHGICTKIIKTVKCKDCQGWTL
eukprot:814648_1